MKVAVNGRFHAHRPTGMQRYALSVSNRLAGKVECLKPPVALRGPAGHLWEQTLLPISARGRLLWSPNNTGPLAAKRHVCTMHDLIPLEHPEWFNPRFAAWYQWLLPRLARQLDHVVAISEFTRQRVEELLGVPRSRITVVPNGVDAAFRPRTAEETAGVRKRFELGSGPYLLYVGSLEPRKNLAGLMKAWRLALEGVPDDVQLVVTGAAGRSAVFAEQTLGEIPARVKFTSYVPEEDLPALYAGAMAVVYPSLYEGFGLPVLEAMASGAPVITSSTTSLPEVAGEAGVLVDPSNTGEIAEAIRTVVNDTGMRERMRTAGLERAREFTWERCTTETWRVLEAYA
jgi:glycosyltransferase involved in cell wall biosynthesis